jgi:hypothetical protein
MINFVAVVSMVKLRLWILKLCLKCIFIVDSIMTLECRDTQLWPIFLGASQYCLWSPLKGRASQWLHIP